LSTNAEWIAAKKRAKFMQRILIQDKSNFDTVMNVLKDDTVKEPAKMVAFCHACSKASLDASETSWLWNYLKEYNNISLWAATEHPGETLASSGW
jgi:hypothetical protein